MGLCPRFLDREPVSSLADYDRAVGGEALAAARAAECLTIIDVVSDSGRRGRGGAGFPTGTKWRTVSEMGGGQPPTVVVNAAEGEPGTLKDRTLLRRNPYKVLEGALIAAHAVVARSEEHTSELQSLMRISYAVFCLKKKTLKTNKTYRQQMT